MQAKEGLNPYSNGICSVSKGRINIELEESLSLNPYSNGICSVSERTKRVPVAHYGKS